MPKYSVLNKKLQSISKALEALEEYNKNNPEVDLNNAREALAAQKSRLESAIEALKPSKYDERSEQLKATATELREQFAQKQKQIENQIKINAVSSTKNGIDNLAELKKEKTDIETEYSRLESLIAMRNEEDVGPPVTITGLSLRQKETLTPEEATQLTQLLNEELKRLHSNLKKDQDYFDSFKIQFALQGESALANLIDEKNNLDKSPKPITSVVHARLEEINKIVTRYNDYGGPTFEAGINAQKNHITVVEAKLERIKKAFPEVNTNDAPVSEPHTNPNYGFIPTAPKQGPQSLNQSIASLQNSLVTMSEALTSILKQKPPIGEDIKQLTTNINLVSEELNGLYTLRDAQKKDNTDSPALTRGVLKRTQAVSDLRANSSPEKSAEELSNASTKLRASSAPESLTQSTSVAWQKVTRSPSLPPLPPTPEVSGQTEEMHGGLPQTPDELRQELDELGSLPPIPSEAEQAKIAKLLTDVTNQIGEYNHKQVVLPLGDGAPKMLYAGCDDYKKAHAEKIDAYTGLANDPNRNNPRFFREAFAQIVVEVNASTQGNYAGDKALRSSDPVNATTSMEKLFGKKGAYLYEKALEEEANSVEYMDAVLAKSTQKIDGPTWAERPIILVAGPSGSGKSYSAQKAAEMASAGFKTKEGNIDNYLVSIDGGTLREVSQMRNLAVQCANNKGYTGIIDLHGRSKCLEVPRDCLRNAVFASPTLGAVIPETFSSVVLDLQVENHKVIKQMTEAIQLQSAGAVKTVPVFFRVDGADPADPDRFKQAVLQQGVGRAWLQRGFKDEADTASKADDKQKKPELDGNAKVAAESKLPTTNFGFRRGKEGSITVEEWFKEKYPQATRMLIYNDAQVMKPDGENKWIPANPGDKGVIVVSEKVYLEWVKDHQKNGNLPLEKFIEEKKNPQNDKKLMKPDPAVKNNWVSATQGETGVIVVSEKVYIEWVKDHQTAGTKPLEQFIEEKKNATLPKMEVTNSPLMYANKVLDEAIQNLKLLIESASTKKGKSGSFNKQSIGQQDENANPQGKQEANPGQDSIPINNFLVGLFKLNKNNNNEIKELKNNVQALLGQDQDKKIKKVLDKIDKALEIMINENKPPKPAIVEIHWLDTGEIERFPDANKTTNPSVAKQPLVPFTASGAATKPDSSHTQSNQPVTAFTEDCTAANRAQFAHSKEGSNALRAPANITTLEPEQVIKETFSPGG